MVECWKSQQNVTNRTRLDYHEVAPHCDRFVAGAVLGLELIPESLVSDAKQKILQEILVASRVDEPILSDSEKRLLQILNDAGDQGHTLDQIVRKFYEGSSENGNGHGRLRALKTRLAEKVAEFFKSSGDLDKNKRSVRYGFVVSKSRGGRRKGRFRLVWGRWKQTAADVVDPEGSIALTSGSLMPDLVQIAFAKLSNDFRFSALSDPERFVRANAVVREGIEFMVATGGMRGAEGRVPETQRTLKLPPLGDHPEKVCAKLTARCSQMLAARDILVNCECIEIGALSALLSMKHKYESDWTILDEDKSGRMQMIRLCDDDDAAFLITANAPFFFMGEGKGLDYRFIAPIHAEAQVILRHKGHRSAVPKIVVYTRSSAYEQLVNMRARRPQNSIWGQASPWPPELLDAVAKAKIDGVDTLDELVERALRLEPGDLVIAWPPLSDGLQKQQPALVAVGDDFKHWISLFCRHDYLPLADEFLWLFAYEFNTCARFPEYARNLIRRDAFFWDYFSGAAGLKK